MPKGPPVHEIFNPPISGKIDTSSNFHYEKKESRTQTQLSTKKTLAPLPPMKKFGGYKPKILGGNDDLIPISSNKPQSPDPPVEHRRPPAPPPVLTQPKPFIIGDKNTPMVLSTVDDNVIEDRDIHNEMDDMHIYEEPPMYNKPSGDDNGEVNNNNMNNFNNNMSSYYIGELNNNAYPNGEHSNHHHNNHHLNNTQQHTTHSLSSNSEAFNVSSESENLINKSHIEKDPTAFATENPVFNHMDTAVTDTDDSRIENESEPEGVFIPAPDYEEDERTMEFDDEDPDELLDEQRIAQFQKQQRPKHLQQQQNGGTQMKVYEGEDLSKYLSDDEDDFRENVDHTRTMPVRLNQKHSLFKTNPNNTTGKRKTSSKKNAPKFNSVRNFSFADSKYATSGKAGGKKLNGGGGSGGGGGNGDYESFLSTSQQGEGYETFLTSKHGVSTTETSPAGHHQPKLNGKQGGDGLWKKLTVRLKHKKQKNGYDMQEQF